MTAAVVLKPFDTLIEEARTQALQRQRSPQPAPRAARAIAIEPELELERFASLDAANDARGRRGLSIPASVALHAAAAAAVVILPLLFSESLTLEERGTRAFFVEPMSVPAPPPPPPPAPARAASAPRATAQPTATQAAFTAPVEVPTEIVPETGLDIGVEGGVPGGVEGGVPGGVVGGVVAGLPEAPPPPVPAPVRVGGSLRAPHKVVDVAAVYPDLALRARVQGVVIIEATIDTKGRVQDAKVLRGLPMLDEAALAAVRQWVYTPTLLNGIPTPIIMTVTVQFQLKNQ